MDGYENLPDSDESRKSAVNAFYVCTELMLYLFASRHAYPNQGFCITFSNRKVITYL